MTPGSHALVTVELAELGQELSQLRLCNDAAVAEMVRSLRCHGQLAPVLAYHDRGKLELIDGFKRLRAAERLGWRELEVELRGLGSAEATWLVWQANAGARLSELEQAWVIRSLYRQRGLSQPEIGRRLGRHKSWVCRRLLLAEGLSEGVEASLRLGLVTATVARELARLPRGNQDQVAVWVARHGLTSRQSARLVDKLLAVDPARWSRLLQASRSLPRTEKPADRNHTKPTAAQSLLASAEALKRACVRFEVRLMQGPASGPDESLTELLSPTLGELRESLEVVGGLLEAFVSRYGLKGDVP